jgi:hypothetical protein
MEAAGFAETLATIKLQGVISRRQFSLYSWICIGKTEGIQGIKEHVLEP